MIYFPSGDSLEETQVRQRNHLKNLGDCLKRQVSLSLTITPVVTAIDLTGG